MKENEKIDKYLGFVGEQIKNWNMTVTVVSTIVGELGIVLKSLGGRNIGRIRNHSFAKLRQNNERNPEDLRKLAVTQTLVKYHHQKLVSKTRKELQQRYHM